MLRVRCGLGSGRLVPVCPLRPDVLLSAVARFLDVSATGISGSLPPAMLHLSALQQLSLSDAHFSGCPLCQHLQSARLLESAGLGLRTLSAQSPRPYHKSHLAGPHVSASAASVVG